MNDGTVFEPKIILEGTHLTYKTDIAFAIAENPRLVKGRIHRYHLPMISAEWEVLHAPKKQPFAQKNSIINFHPEEEEYAMETFETWMRILELQRHWYWIIDRFHISTRAYQLTNFKKDYPFDWLEERLAALNFHIIFCTRTTESFEKARQERLTYSETPSNYENLQIFMEEQDLMRELINQSRLKTLELDISNISINGAANYILDWLGVPNSNPEMEARGLKAY